MTIVRVAARGFPLAMRANWLKRWFPFRLPQVVADHGLGQDVQDADGVEEERDLGTKDKGLLDCIQREEVGRRRLPPASPPRLRLWHTSGGSAAVGRGKLWAGERSSLLAVAGQVLRSVGPSSAGLLLLG